MASIDPTMVCYHQLNATAIAAMGMYKLGDASWAMIAPSMEPRTKWSSFKKDVELLFGLSTSCEIWACCGSASALHQAVDISDQR